MTKRHSPSAQAAAALVWLKRRGTKRNRDGMARFGIVAPKVFGVSMGTMQPLTKRFGHSHELALALWRTGWLEARILAAFVDEPDRVTVAQMNEWASDFDNWAVCDSVCIRLFQRTPHAWGRISAWSSSRDEFVKRAAFALLASVAVHHKAAPDAPFLKSLRFIERAAVDERNFVRKAVSWALRTVGQRNAVLHAASARVARRLAKSSIASARWIGSDTLREFARPLVQQRLARRAVTAQR